MVEKTNISVEVIINLSIEKVWEFWTSPEFIVKWNYASDDWHTPLAENDLRVGGKFMSRMQARDGSMGFDFEGIYTSVKKHELIEYVLADDRKVRIEFSNLGNETKVVERFDAEDINSAELQRSGWQNILNNFKTFAEQNKN